MNATTTVILGGGFGGLTVANSLRKRLTAGHQIVLVDQSPTFLVGATKTWVMLGQRTPEEVVRQRSALSQAGVRLLEARVTHIHPESGAVETTQGSLQPDFLVIALGAHLNLAAIPGLESAAQTFYTLEGAARLRQALDDFDGGEVIVLIPRLPFKCPPAPYEAALLLQHAFGERGLLDRTRLSIYTVEGAPMATAGPEMGRLVRDLLSQRGVAFNPQKRAVSVDATARSIAFEDGSAAHYDLLIAIPPHEAPPVVRQAGLVGPSGWVPVDALTLRVAGVASRIQLYAIGDVAGIPLPGRFTPDTPLALPKAGVLAEAQGLVVAGHIAAQVLGGEASQRFDGRGACYIETGADQAIRAEGQFFALPHPLMQADPESGESYQEKLRWVEGWLGGEG